MEVPGFSVDFVNFISVKSSREDTMVTWPGAFIQDDWMRSYRMKHELLLWIASILNHQKNFVWVKYRDRTSVAPVQRMKLRSYLKI